MYGDLVFWPLSADQNRARSRGNRDHHPNNFWQAHRAALESGLLSEFVIGEIGRTLFSAGQTAHVDRFQGQSYMYGTCEDDEHDGSSLAQNGDDDVDDDYDGEDVDGWNDDDPYEDRLFYSFGAQEWFENVVATDDTPSFGRKLLIIIGRDAESRFLESRIGQQLRARLGQSARVVLNAQGVDAAAIAFEHHSSCADLFEQIKRFLPPRLVEDFLIMNIGMNYCTGDQPISVFAEWAGPRSDWNQDQSRRLPGEGGRTAMIPVEIKRRRPRPGPSGRAAES